ncbi:hypothetical protein SLS62_002678 [Diatrype stigma]|uniref:FAD-binding domain-containing protein n=1 Tax=Diatrype stigma TaxID=117547 RepID=A0AAN9YVK0_9PEZI
MSERPFRVIIVGAGPVGLYLAGALSKANIDFVVLEQYHSISTNAGAGIIIWPHSVRLLDQLGLLDEMKKISGDFDNKTDLLQNGQVIRLSPVMGLMEKRFGYPTFGTSRGDLIRVLYEGLPNHEDRVKTNARIVDMETNAEGVRVHLKDGTVEEGSIVVGTDGVHSKTREAIQRLSNTSTGKHPMTATFYGIYGNAPAIDGCEVGMFYETRGPGRVIQLSCMGDRMFYALLKTLDRPTTEKRSYSAEEMEQVAVEFAEDFVTPTVKFKEVWAVTDKTTARLVNQEEGFAEKWYHERIALVGDSAHKMTSITGQGFNSGMHSAAFLANELRKTLQSNPNPTTEVLEETFARYQRAREGETQALFQNGLDATRQVTWYSWRAWVLDRFIFPWLDGTHKFEQFCGLIRGGQVLDYVPAPVRKGKLPWLRNGVSPP